ncbi:unnamed protein product [Ilex paraguariensis]|uniref:Terpene synthase metal-binding domain-containing protein n=1 Tax=Ilex paraguariensis TaxID=185542 RepID=A0ABC8R9V8_9AQUA
MEFEELVKCYEIEDKWCSEGYVATFDEYMTTRLITGGNLLLGPLSVLGMGKFYTIEAFEWLHNRPKVFVASSIIGLLMNDIASHEV